MKIFQQIPLPLLLSLLMCGKALPQSGVTDGRNESPLAPMSQDIYLWQRDWNQAVRDAIIEHGSNFERIVTLNAEVTWQAKRPEIVEVPVDYALLKQSGIHVGLALRVGPYPGPFLETDKTTAFLIRLAVSLVHQARANGCGPSELQIDFDCAQSKLDGYRVWVVAIRRAIAPVPVIVTALPSWLNEPSFPKLIASADGYVLQVHSLEAPKSASAPFTLCDPAEAQRAVKRAGQWSVPFRVALPTYGYLIAFNRNGKFTGLSADGPRKDWPPDYQLREVRTDPVAMAELVRFWATNHPASMRGIIWYRLPVADDVLNLRWPTLTAMMAGRVPREHVHAAARRIERGLVEISLVNDGELDLSSRLAVEVTWTNARLVAGDGIGGFNLGDAGPATARFQVDDKPFRLPAGEKRIIGWLRLSEDREVKVEIKIF
ncbi:MAG TPA: DUF3142 domain-containing protein [Verrucomicrobiae bacterium]